MSILPTLVTVQFVYTVKSVTLGNTIAYIASSLKGKRQAMEANQLHRKYVYEFSDEDMARQCEKAINKHCHDSGIRASVTVSFESLKRVRQYQS